MGLTGPGRAAYRLQTVHFFFCSIHYDHTPQAASLVRLRVLFFLLLDRDTVLKDKVLDGWAEWCVAGVERKKAGGFFRHLRGQVIEPWLVDERRCEDDFVSSCIDLYLVM